MNLFIRGPRGIGKSTLVDKAVAALQKKRSLSIGGFMTFRDMSDGEIYIADAKIPRFFDVSFPVGNPKSGAIPGVFDAYAERLLESISKSDLIILDELGFLEESSPIFQQAVISCLCSGVPVVGVLKDRDVPWYRKLQENSVDIFDITYENRDVLIDEIPALLRSEI